MTRNDLKNLKPGDKVRYKGTGTHFAATVLRLAPADENPFRTTAIEIERYGVRIFVPHTRFVVVH
jgi:hypothetical protein